MICSWDPATWRVSFPSACVPRSEPTDAPCEIASGLQAVRPALMQPYLFAAERLSPSTRERVPEARVHSIFRRGSVLRSLNGPPVPLTTGPIRIRRDAIGPASLRSPGAPLSSTPAVPRADPGPGWAYGGGDGPRGDGHVLGSGRQGWGVAGATAETEGIRRGGVTRPSGRATVIGGGMIRRRSRAIRGPGERRGRRAGRAGDAARRP